MREGNNETSRSRIMGLTMIGQCVAGAPQGGDIAGQGRGGVAPVLWADVDGEYFG